MFFEHNRRKLKPARLLEIGVKSALGKGALVVVTFDYHPLMETSKNHY